jgi:hypothetical protein
MTKKFQNKLFFVSLFFLISGTAFLALERIFYQYIDKNGVLHESWFMPLGVLGLLFGCIGLVFVVLKEIWSFIKNLIVS